MIRTSLILKMSSSFKSTLKFRMNSSAISVLTNTEKGLELDERNLRRIFLKDGISDLPVCCISVAGAMRTGKSFLLDYLLRHLRQNSGATIPGGQDSGATIPGGQDSGATIHGEQDSDATIPGGQDSGATIPGGFSWRNGMTRHTSGIQIYPDPVIVDGVAVFLIDTQGTFDRRSSVRENMTIFAMACLTSSHLVYNLMHIIREDHLQNLQLFTEYGRLAGSSGAEANKPFQNLLFLVRDWQYVQDADFGQEGGSKLLDDVMEFHENQDKNANKLRQHIASSFENLSCYLLPYPGQHVAENPDFIGQPELLDPRFKQHLDSLVINTFSPQNLSPKQIGGRVVKVGEMYDLYSKYMEIFSGDSLPEPQSIYETTAKLVFLHALKESKEKYIEGLEISSLKSPDEPETMDSLRKRHNNVKKQCLTHFTNTTKFGDLDQRKIYEKILEDEIQKYYVTIKKLNDAKILNRYHQSKDNYTKDIDHHFQNTQEPFHEQDLEKLHLKVKTESTNLFKNQEGKFLSDELSSRLVQSISGRYEDYKKLNLVRIQLYFRKIQDEVVRKYKEQMGNALEGPFSVHQMKLENEHETVKKQLLLEFSSSNDYGSKMLKENTEASLAKIMNEKSGVFKELNDKKTLKNRVTRTVKHLGDNETYRDIWTNPKKQKMIASSAITIIIVKTYFGL